MSANDHFFGPNGCQSIQILLFNLSTSATATRARSNCQNKQYGVFKNKNVSTPEKTSVIFHPTFPERPAPYNRHLPSVFKVAVVNRFYCLRFSFTDNHYNSSPENTNKADLIAEFKF